MTIKIPKIAIVRTEDIDDNALVQHKMYELLDLMQANLRIPPDACILIKVNLCLLLDCETGATVDPRLVKYLAEWLLERYSIKEIIIAEADATALSADRAYYGLGWDQILNQVTKTSYVNLTSDERVKVQINGLYFSEVEMSKTFMEADCLISFAKLKTHSIQGISGIMKNQFGALPEKLKIKYHPHLSEVICDMVRVRPPDLCLVDGLIAQEGPGPVSGIPRLMRLIIAGTDAVATDHACTRIIGMNPHKVPHLRLALKHNLGESRYEILGCCIDDVVAKFAYIPRWRQAWMRVREHIQHA